MLQRIRDYVKLHNMLGEQQIVVIGLSGGADSVCLAVVLKEMQQEYGYTLKAVHVNHEIRGAEAEADEAFCREFCSRNDIQLKVVNRNVPSLAGQWHMSVEEAGRKVRYEAFYEALGDAVGRIAVAHHKNDNAETVIFNMVRGSDVGGLSGIKAVNGNIIRPLLTVDRSEIESFLQERGQPYCTDSTNASNEYARNMLRNQVIPMLGSINDRAVDNICAAADRLGEVAGFLERVTQAALRECVFYSEDAVPPACKIELDKFYQYDRLVQENILYRVICSCAQAKKDIERVHVKCLLELAYKPTGKRINLPYGLVAEKEYNRLYIAGQDRKKTGKDSSLCGKGSAAYDKDCEFDWKMHICYSREELEEFIQNNGEEFIEKKFCTKEIDCGKIKNRLILRSRQPNDYIVIGREGQRKSVSRFFIDEKIPRRMRDMPIVFDGNEAVWIVGRRLNPRYDTDSHTQSVATVVVYGRYIQI